MLETARREVVEALAPQIPADTADVSTRSKLAHPRDVPFEDRDGVSLVLVEQLGVVPGLRQLWLTLTPVDGGSDAISTLHMRLSRHDPLGVERLRAPSVNSYPIHTRQDGPLTDSLVEARTASEVLSVQWEMVEWVSQADGVQLQHLHSG